MILLTLFAFLAGIVTILSPCILPLLPVILSSSDAGGKQKPLGVVVGFIASFTFFTLFLTSFVRWCGIAPDSLRFLSIAVLGIFGVSLLLPRFQTMLEVLFSRLANKMPSAARHQGFVGGILIGLSLGLLWTPCVGPILASVITLAVTGTVTAHTFLITFAYAVGTALPMFLVMLVGSAALKKVPWLVRNTQKIQRGFGVIMIATAAAIYLHIDRQFQTYILEAFPNYGIGLTQFEDNNHVLEQLRRLRGEPIDEAGLGKPMTDLMPKGMPAAELIGGGEWFNSEPLRLSELKGKVVLIDFWTYSCINCQRTFPYLRDWWEKYQGSGLVIIGVHSPEFEFEKNPANVQRAIEDFSLTYPIMQDNQFETWRAYKNRYWPAKYLIDKDGNIRYTHFGEGEYDETERKIQELLAETGEDVSGVSVSNSEYQIYSRTPELYLGYSRIEHLASPEPVRPEQQTTFSAPLRIPDNKFAYSGSWTVMSEYAAPHAGAQLFLNFEAKEVFLVARPEDGTVGTMQIMMDGEVAALGEDVDGGKVTVDSDRLYKLILLPEPGRHLLRIDFPEGNVEVYAFTFG